jgi:hypothetical protein
VRLASLLVIALGGAAIAKPQARAKPHMPSSRFTNPDEAATLPAVRYGKLTQDECEAELTARHIQFAREPAKGVRQPVRVSSALHGVEFRTNEKDHGTNVHEITDCRLVLALDDLAQMLAAHDVVEVRHYSIYRAPEKSWPEGKVASRHNGALAIDAARFVKSDGSFLDVLEHFHGHIGAKTCGDGAGPHPVTPEATEIREILCSAVDAHLFNVVLTPNYNRPHRNHFHLELTENVSWFLVH